MPPTPCRSAGVRARGELSCAQIAGNKNPAIAAGFYTLRECRAGRSALHHFPLATSTKVSHEQFIV